MKIDFKPNSALH